MDKLLYTVELVILSKMDYEVALNQYNEQLMIYNAITEEIKNIEYVYNKNFKDRMRLFSSMELIRNKEGYIKKMSSYQSAQRILERKLRDIVFRKKQASNDLVKVKKEKEILYNKYLSNNANLDNLFQKISLEQLRKTTKYLDINIEKNDDFQTIINRIKENIIEDFEILLKNTIFDIETYRGKITVIKFIINLKNVLTTKVDESTEIKEKINNLSVRLSKNNNSLKNLKFRLEELNNSPFHKIFNRLPIYELTDEIGKLEQSTLQTTNKLSLLKAKLKILEDEINNLYVVYISLLEFLDKSIEKLGERTLKDLIKQLQIKVIQTEDNYLDEIFEMKLELRKWFNVIPKEDLDISNEEKIRTKIQNPNQKVKKINES